MSLYAVIEIPKGSKVKYEHDKKTGKLVVDRILPYSMVYPCNYGYIPDTLAKDGDPVDVFVLVSETIIPSSMIRILPLGMITMIDDGLEDNKIIAVCQDDPNFDHITTINDLCDHQLKEIIHFLENYKPGNIVRINEVLPAKDAYMYIRATSVTGSYRK